MLSVRLAMGEQKQAMFLCMSQTDAYHCLLLNEMLRNILHDLPCYNTASGAQAAGIHTVASQRTHAHTHTQTPSNCYSVYEQATDTQTHTHARTHKRYTMFIKHTQYRDYPGLENIAITLFHSCRTLESS